MRTLALALLVIASCAAARAGAACTPLAKLKFQVDERGHMLIAGDLNGRRMWLAVDTGGVWSLIAEALVRDMRLTVRRARVVAVDAAGVALDRHVSVPKMALGPYRLKGANDFLVMRSLGEPATAGGALGLNVLNRFDVAIDNARRTFALFAPASCTPGQGWLALPMLPETKHTPGLPILAGTLGPTPARVLIDTGSTATYLDRTFAERQLGIDRHSPGVARAGALTTPTGSELEAWSYIVPAMAIGGLQLTNVPVLIADAPTADVTLGQAQLQSLNLHFAFAERRVYVAAAR